MRRKKGIGNVGVARDGHNATLAEIARELGCSEQHVVKITNQALRKLRAAVLANDVLREEAQDMRIIR